MIAALRGSGGYASTSSFNSSIVASTTSRIAARFTRARRYVVRLAAAVRLRSLKVFSSALSVVAAFEDLAERVDRRVGNRAR